MMRPLNEKEEPHKDLTNPRRYPTEGSHRTAKKKEKNQPVPHKESTQEESKERCPKSQWNCRRQWLAHC